MYMRLCIAPRGLYSIAPRRECFHLRIEYKRHYLLSEGAQKYHMKNTKARVTLAIDWTKAF